MRPQDTYLPYQIQHLIANNAILTYRNILNIRFWYVKRINNTIRREFTKKGSSLPSWYWRTLYSLTKKAMPGAISVLLNGSLNTAL